MKEAPGATGCTLAADLQFNGEGAVSTRHFDDIYYHPGSGADEARHVFIDGNQLPRRWQALTGSDKHGFTIVETGFGTGLNFLSAWQLWRSIDQLSDADAGKTLSYYSVERYPLTHAALARCLQHYNPYPELSQQLLDAYPDAIANSYLLEFEGGKVKLVLLFADALEALDSLEHYPAAADHTLEGNDPENKQQNGNLRVDAWFLDGFAPSKNPQMWSDELFRRMARHSHPQTTAATFTVARQVRDGLAAAGFACEKRPGYGRKREMLAAKFDRSLATGELATARSYTLSPCYWRGNSRQAGEQQKALVIGAGIAGSCIARELARRKWQVSVVDSAGDYASAASGNERAVLYARTNDTGSALGRFHEASFHYATGFYRQLGLNSESLGLNGMIQQLEKVKRDLSRLPASTELRSRRTVSASEASELAGIELASGGIYYPDSGWLSPREVCQHLLDDKLITFLPQTRVESLQPGDGRWQVVTSPAAATANLAEFDAVIIACGQASAGFSQTRWLPLKSIRGQTTHIDSHSPVNRLQRVVCQRGYLTPAYNASDGEPRHCLGATFTLDEKSEQPRQADQHENIDNMLAALKATPELDRYIEGLDYASLGARVSFRCVTPDYLPIAGPIVDADAFRQRYAALAKNARQTPAKRAPLLAGLFASTGYGSRGFSAAPLASAMLAAQVTGEPIPISDDLRQNISPVRFLLRQIIKGK